MSKDKKFKEKKSNKILIDAEFRIQAEKSIDEFVNSDEMTYEFPSILSNVERAFIHNLAPKYNLKTKSHGMNENRRLSLYKLTENEKFLEKSLKINLDPVSVDILKEFTTKYPENGGSVTNSSIEIAEKVTSKPLALSKPPGIPNVPKFDLQVVEKRFGLPIMSFREEILSKIEQSKILLVHGSTGSGKTTQIPQFILEDSCMKQKPCRILCTQPRRISAIAAADRVSYERNEVTGTTVGYQVRLESSVDPSSNCVFLTPGIFLRYLTLGVPSDIFNNITHILIDEAHERAKENDFLLTSIKENLHVNPDIKIIIMSATLETSIFANYFDNNCDSISISTRQFAVEEIFLEDILKRVNFNNSRVEELNEKFKKGELKSASQSAYINELSNGPLQDEKTIEEVDEETANYLDEIINGLNSGDADNFEENLAQFMYAIQNEDLPVDYRHSESKMTALMVCVGRGSEEAVKSLLCLGANPQLKFEIGDIELTCLEAAYRLHGGESEIRRSIQNHLDSKGARNLSSDEVYNKALLNIYYDSTLKTKFNKFEVEETIDHDLIVKIIEKIHLDTPRDGGILCFLPGFDDILQVDDVLKRTLQNGFEIFMLHSSMRTEDQKNVFKTLRDRRKIILSTNIAESSITVPDIVYVVDSGREKQKSYDSLSQSSSLKVQWISKASANQRKGRAGRLRDGFVFRVYSKDRYNSMLKEAIPELLRNSISEICLQSKLLVGNSIKIEEFLGRCIAKPSQPNIRQSVKLLQAIGALDQQENLTLLGSHLAQMPVDAKYGKMIIFAILLRCFDPILSIVSVMSMEDRIFVIPVRAGDRMKCNQIRFALGGNSMSDHFVMLKIFDMWMDMKRNKFDDRRFAEENFINNIAMEQAKGVRGQILSYLENSGLLKSSKNSLNENSYNWSVIKLCLSAGLYPNIAKIDQKNSTISTDIDQKLTIHKQSNLAQFTGKMENFKNSLSKLPAELIIFEEKMRFGRTVMLKCNTLISNLGLTLSAGAVLNSEVIENHENEDGNDEPIEHKMSIKIDNNIGFMLNFETGSLILDMRHKLERMIAKFLTTKSAQTRDEEDLVRMITKIVEIEDKHSGFEDVQMKFSGRTQQILQRNKIQPIFRSAASSSNSGSTFYEEQTNMQKKRIKFFVTQITQFHLNNLGSRKSCAVEDLRLSPWLMDQIYHPKMSSVQIFIFFYSSDSDNFLGYGDIKPSKSRNQSKIFQHKSSKNFSLMQLREKFFFRNFTLFQSRFKTEEISFDTGNALKDLFHS